MINLYYLYTFSPYCSVEIFCNIFHLKLVNLIIIHFCIFALRRCSDASRSARMFTSPPTSAKRDVKIENASESSSFTTREKIMFKNARSAKVLMGRVAWQNRENPTTNMVFMLAGVERKG